MKNRVKRLLTKALNEGRKFSKKRQFFAGQTNTFGLSDAKIKKAYKMGFTADEYVIYDLEHNNPDDYVSEFERELFRESVKNYRILLDNKIVFYHLIRNYANTNTIFAYKQSGTYQVLESGWEPDKILVNIEKRGRICYKKMFEGGGRGFCLIEYRDGDFYINRTKKKPDDVSQLIQTDNYLLEEYCEQGDFEDEIWPYSVNTLRLITLKEDDNIELVAAFQRVGASREKCVDNACAGGLYSNVDIETGILGSARSHSKDKWADEQGNSMLFDRHPIANTLIKGLTIPNWETIKKDVVRLHEKLLFTNISFIAWDVAVLNDGIKIIEANTSCSMDLLQTFSGMRKEKIGKWMESRGFLC